MHPYYQMEKQGNISTWEKIKEKMCWNYAHTAISALGRFTFTSSKINVIHFKVVFGHWRRSKQESTGFSNGISSFFRYSFWNSQVFIINASYILRGKERIFVSTIITVMLQQHTANLRCPASDRVKNSSMIITSQVMYAIQSKYAQ